MSNISKMCLFILRRSENVFNLTNHQTEMMFLLEIFLIHISKSLVDLTRQKFKIQKFPCIVIKKLLRRITNLPDLQT